MDNDLQLEGVRGHCCGAPGNQCDSTYNRRMPVGYMAVIYGISGRALHKAETTVKGRT